jgi:ubiquinone/menaquinone biosynthesis C-methylase UbiE
MKRLLFTANALLALCYAGSLLSDDIVLKPHEEWWQKNWQEKDHYWLGGIKMISRVKMRQHVVAKGYKSILDIPCGFCIDYEGLKVDKVPVEYTGMDITPNVVTRGQARGINVKQGSIEAIPMGDSSVDMAYSRHILEHLSYYEKAIKELIRVAVKEVFVTFFIKPLNQKEDVKTLDLNGSPVYHNRYDKTKLEQYVSNFAKVDHFEWEEIDRVESILHIYLKSGINQSSPLKKSVDFDKSLAALDPLYYEGKPYFLAKDFLLEKPVFSGGWNAIMYPEPVTEFYHFLKDLYQRNDPSTIKPGATYKIPRIVHQIWIQGELPEKYRVWAKTWQNIPGWEYKLWTDKEIRALPLKARDSYEKADGYGIKSDIARYEILRLYGGICCDIDFKCLQPQTFDVLNRCYDFYTCIAPLETAVFSIANGFIASAPHHPVMEAMVDFVANHYDPTVADYLRTGPVPFSKMFWHYADKPGYTDIAFPPSFLYPTGTYTPLHLYDQYIKPESLAVHYWARSWSTNPKF